MRFKIDVPWLGLVAQSITHRGTTFAKSPTTYYQDYAPALSDLNILNALKTKIPPRVSPAAVEHISVHRMSIKKRELRGGHHLLVSLDVVPMTWDALLTQESLGTSTIRTSALWKLKCGVDLASVARSPPHPNFYSSTFR
jgi:hypothetical protein